MKKMTHPHLVVGKMIMRTRERNDPCVIHSVLSLVIASRSMARITRSQTTNMVECESCTPRVCVHNRGYG